MNIQNVTQFVNFIVTNNLVNLDSSFLQLTQCLERYSAACNCYKTEDKVKIYNTCNGVYINSIQNVVPRLKHQIMAKTSERQISFYNDSGVIIGVLLR